MSATLAIPTPDVFWQFVHAASGLTFGLALVTPGVLGTPYDGGTCLVVCQLAPLGAWQVAGGGDDACEIALNLGTASLKNGLMDGTVQTLLTKSVVPAMNAVFATSLLPAAPSAPAGPDLTTDAGVVAALRAAIVAALRGTQATPPVFSLSAPVGY